MELQGLGFKGPGVRVSKFCGLGFGLELRVYGSFLSLKNIDALVT